MVKLKLIATTTIFQLLLAVPAFAETYYVNTNHPQASDSNPGTASSPWKTIRKAADVLVAGDTAIIKAGTYTESSPNTTWSRATLTPKNSGTLIKPITFKAAAGERVFVTGPESPIIGQYNEDHIHWEGFVTDKTVTFHSSDGAVVRNMEVIGQYIDTSDNHDGIRIEKSPNTHIHHSRIHGVQGPTVNSAGIKIYGRGSPNVLIEDNYFYNNFVAVYDKENGINNTYRRNLFIGNKFYGNNQGELGSYKIFDNVFLDGAFIDLHFLIETAEVHDNLVFHDRLTGAWAGSIDNAKVWNNILVTDEANAEGFWVAKETCCDPLEYMDYNFYTAQPYYNFDYNSLPDLNLTAFRALGYEANAVVITNKLQLFSSLQTYELRSEWQTAGRYGDKPGPDDVALVLDLTRYGPDARNVETPLAPPNLRGTLGN